MVICKLAADSTVSTGHVTGAVIGVRPEIRGLRPSAILSSRARAGVVGDSLRVGADDFLRLDAGRLLGGDRLRGLRSVQRLAECSGGRPSAIAWERPGPTRLKLCELSEEKVLDKPVLFH